MFFAGHQAGSREAWEARKASSRTTPELTEWADGARQKDSQWEDDSGRKPRYICCARFRRSYGCRGLPEDEVKWTQLDLIAVFQDNRLVNAFIVEISAVAAAQINQPELVLPLHLNKGVSSGHFSVGQDQVIAGGASNRAGRANT